VNGYDERIQLSHEAIQYHYFHTNAGFPQDAEVVGRWGATTETRTPFGMNASGAGL
jgi:hypothetical protein